MCHHPSSRVRVKSSVRSLTALVALLLAPGAWGAETTLAIGSKNFTESVILGELATLLVRDEGATAVHRAALGGTRIVFGALVAGDIDIYAEYTGTLREEILAGRDVESDAAVRSALAERGVVLGAALGFQNTYALGMREQHAAGLEIRRISDLVRHPALVFRFSNEFMDRGDGWPSLQRRYRLPQRDVRGLEHDLAYRGMGSGAIDLIDLYSTDAEIAYYELRTLEDDLAHFPPYQAVWLYRADLEERAPEAIRALARIAGRIDAADMIAMNAGVKLDGEPEGIVAAAFLAEALGVETQPHLESSYARFARHTREHLALVGVSLSAAIALSIPLGILAARQKRMGQLILGVTGVIQTIPALALLVFMIPLLGIGGPPAVMALFLYSLLPIVRNTYTGLTEIPLALREAAEALGLPSSARLRHVELPLAMPSILAGIKTSAVINVGAATLGALIGAGGYGQPILTGIRLDDIGLILEGAVPAAGLALLVQGFFDLVERMTVPKGLRLRADRE